MLHRRITGQGSSADVIVALLEKHTGQVLDTGRKWRIDSTLKPMIRDRGFLSLDDLVMRILSGAEPGLIDDVVDALLNQETSFFRDAGVLDTLACAATRMEERAGRRLRIWSAACSTGQEPLSLAMLFCERHARTGQPMPEIRATDMSRRAIDRAVAGRYTQFEIQRGLPVGRMIEWFEPDGAAWVARRDLRHKVLYARHNLIKDPMPPGRFDMILCRNVLMYLPPALRRHVLEQLACVLRPDGLLVLGAGETVIGATDLLVPSDQYRGMYRLPPRG